MSKKYVRMIDAAEELGISRQLLLYRIKSGVVRYETVLGVRVVTRAEVNRLKRQAGESNNRKNGKK